MKTNFRNVSWWIWIVVWGSMVHYVVLAQSQNIVIYNNNFTNGETTYWSTTITDPEWQRPVRVGFTGNAAERVLGDFGDQRVTLQLPQLPPHDSITITFDFITIRSWDGNSSLYGPDLLELKIDDTLLFRSSFSNTSYRQSFPDKYPTSHAARSGAVAFNSLGYIWRFPGLFSGPMDATYRITQTVHHTAPVVNVYFSVFLDDPGQDITNESWAIDNVTLSITPSKSAPVPQSPLLQKTLPGTGG